MGGKISKVKTNSIVLQARYDETWTLKSFEVLEGLWNDIKDGLKDPRFEVYYAFCWVFGEKVAREVGINRVVVSPNNNEL